MVVGVNRFTDDSPPLAIHAPDYSALEGDQRTRLAQVKRSRNSHEVTAALQQVRRSAREAGPLMPPIIDAVRARVTLGEISDTLRDVWGAYRPA